MTFDEDEGYYRNRHSVYLLQYHLVVVTKYRHPVIRGSLRDRLLELSHRVLEEKWKCHISAMNTDGDHIHILFETSPQTQLSVLANNYKTVTSRYLRKEFEKELRPYYWKPYFWSDSYFICTVSDRTEEMVKRYIENQGKRKYSRG